MCTYSLLACYFVKSVNCNLSDVVKNSIQKLRAGRKLRALGKLRVGITAEGRMIGHTRSTHTLGGLSNFLGDMMAEAAELSISISELMSH